MMIDTLRIPVTIDAGGRRTRAVGPEARADNAAQKFDLDLNMQRMCSINTQQVQKTISSCPPLAFS